MITTMQKVLWLILVIAGAFSAQVSTAQFRALDEDAARVCLDIGVRAEIRGLEDIELSLAGNQGRRDGDEGAQYAGVDTFFLESNAPVRVLVSAGPLSNGLDVLATNYAIDNGAAIFETKSNRGHSQEHQLNVTAQLGEISAQLAGEYRSTLVLTVIPQITNQRRCKPNTAVPESEIVDAIIDVEVGSDQVIPSESQLGSGELERSMLKQQVYSEIPTQFLELMDLPDVDSVFPLLQEFRLWSTGVTPTLSEQARYWWMFPRNESLLDQILGR